tara:strand:- start:863 stop:1246 length:384 start_codon:yes stop_codon:yes gene_type:complete
MQRVEKPFQLTDKAKQYDFLHRPFDDKIVQATKERDLFKKQMYGIRGSPDKSNYRYINKIFDYGRKNAKEAMNTHGCDLDYTIRELLMKVGEVPRGDYKGLDEKVATEKFYRIMNIDLNSKSEHEIA